MRDSMLVVGMLATYGVAWGLDQVLDGARRALGPSLETRAYLWALPLSRLALAICLLLLAYGLVTKPSKSKLPGLVFLIVGLALTLYQTPAFIPLWGHLPAPVGSLFELPHTDSLVSITSAFVGMTGLLGLSLRRLP